MKAEKERIVILGAGPAGLSAGWKLAEGGADVLVLEREREVGGLSRTFTWNKMRLDYGPHKIYTQDAKLRAEVESLFSHGELLSIPKKSRIRLMGKYFDFPVSTKELLLKMNPLVSTRCGVSYAKAIAKSKFFKPNEGSYESYMIHRFGRSTYRLIFGPYARKVWGEPKKLSASLGKSRVAVPSLLDLAKRLVMGEKGKPEISAKEFHYPRKGVAELSEKMAQRIRKAGGRIIFNAEIDLVEVEDGRVSRVDFTAGGKKQSFSPTQVISTIPIAETISLFKPRLPATVLDAASGLRHRNLILAVLVVGRDRVFEDNWLFFPEEKYVFNRVYEQKGFSPEMVPKGKTAVCAEITCWPTDSLWRAKDASICERVAGDLDSADVIKKDEVLECGVFRVENAYPIYDLGYEEKLSTVLSFLDSLPNFYAIGRNGSFNYIGMLDCMDMGIRTAKHILSSESRPDWHQKRKSFQNYVTVD